MLALPIFPGRRQPSIFSTSELNFRVRNGNGWTLTAINTNYFSFERKVNKRNARTFLLFTALSAKTIVAYSTFKIKTFFLTHQRFLVTRGRIELPFAA